jgi:hypothetical protein
VSSDSEVLQSLLFYNDQFIDWLNYVPSLSRPFTIFARLICSIYLRERMGYFFKLNDKNGGKSSQEGDYLKGVWHEIFDFKFFSWISVPQAPKYSIGAFWKIRGDIHKLMFIAGVNDTGDKLFSGVNDTGEQFIFPRCRWYRSEKKPIIIAGVNGTAEKLFTGVNDTADKFFGGVSDTGD